MSIIKLNWDKTESRFIAETRNILSKYHHAINIYESLKEPKDINAAIKQGIEIIKIKTSESLLINKIYKWNKIILNKKRIMPSREKKKKQNLINFWQNNNICAAKYSYELFKELKIDKYINFFFEKLYHNCEYPLFDEYEINNNKTFDNNSLFIQEIHFYNFEQQNSQKNDDIHIINKKAIIINIKQDENSFFESEYENSFIEEVNKFADECLRNKVYNNQSSYG